VQKPADKAPAIVTVLCILSIVLGGLGVLGSVMGLLALAAPQTPAKIPTTASTPQAQQAMVDMQKELVDAISWMRPYQGVAAGLYLLVAIALVVGGGMALGSKPIARKLLLVAYPVGAVLSLVEGTLGYVSGRATAEIMEKYLPKMMSGLAGPAADIARTSVAASMLVGMVLGIGWTLAKVVVFVGGSVIFRRADVRARFGA